MDKPHWYPQGKMPGPPFLPVGMNDAELAFGAATKIADCLPPVELIPDAFDRMGDHGPEAKWVQAVGRMLFEGSKGLELFPKPGIDPEKAFRHVRAVMGSFAPKHEYKMAATAFLLAEWFADVRWQK